MSDKISRASVLFALVCAVFLGQLDCDSIQATASSISSAPAVVSPDTTARGSGDKSPNEVASRIYADSPRTRRFSFNTPPKLLTLVATNASGITYTASQSSAFTVSIYPGQDIPGIVSDSPSSTTFIIYPGIYRLTRPILPKNGDSFVGQTPCAPPVTACPAIISGSSEIGAEAVFNGQNYEITNQSQHGATGNKKICDTGWAGCIYPEDLFFDGVPYQHLKSATLPAIGPGQWWFDYANHTIYFHDSPSGHRVETSVVNNGFGGSANNVTIQYLTVQGFANMYPTGAIGDAQGSNGLTQQTNWTVRQSEIRLNHGFGVRVGYGIQILGNYIHDNGQLGIGGGIAATSNPITASINSGILIQGNIVNHNDYAHFNPGFGAGGFKVGATSGITLRGNTFQYNEGSGIHFDDYSQNELVDGNIIMDNTDGDGLVQEIGYGTSTFRNNIVLRNGAHVNGNYPAYQIGVHASTGVRAYCNVMEIPAGEGINGWGVLASNRGYSAYPGYQYLVTTDNWFHHNTIIWDAGAAGAVGFLQNDPTNQPNFFANNFPPSRNHYHLPDVSAANFVYDDDDSRINQRKSFQKYEATGADQDSTLDTNYASGFPTVVVTSPSDQSSVGDQVTVAVRASDPSGIERVSLYVDWTWQATSTTSPYSFMWTNGTPGPHRITAFARSNAGIATCYALTLIKK